MVLGLGFRLQGLGLRVLGSMLEGLVLDIVCSVSCCVSFSVKGSARYISRPLPVLLSV